MGLHFLEAIMKRKTYYCECSSTDHQLSLIRFDEEDSCGNVVYLNIHLVNKPFFSRLVHAIKHIFGYQCKYGSFDEFIINQKTAKEISDFLKNKC